MMKLKWTIEWGALIAAVGMVVTVIVFVVRLDAEVENHIKHHSTLEDRITAQEGRIAELERRLAAVEARLPEKGAVESGPSPPEESCESARIVDFPTRTGPVRSTMKISWTPAHCKMIVQAYQEGALINEFEKIPQESGAVTIGQAITGSDGVMNLGKAELKIWRPGSQKPSDEGVWVNVRQ